MTFVTILGEHLAMAASAKIFYIAIDYKKKTNMKVEEPVLQTLKYISCLQQRNLGICMIIAQGKISGDLTLIDM